MNERDPKNLVKLVEIEQEQNWSEILSVLENAIENKSEVELTVSNLYGKGYRTATIIPHLIEKDLLRLTTENGEGIAIKLSRIKKTIKVD